MKLNPNEVNGIGGSGGREVSPELCVPAAAAEANTTC